MDSNAQSDSGTCHVVEDLGKQILHNLLYHIKTTSVNFWAAALRRASEGLRGPLRASEALRVPQGARWMEGRMY